MSVSDSLGEQPSVPPLVPESSDLANVMLATLRGTVSKPDIYLIRAAQSTTLKQIRASRKVLREFNTSSKQQLDAQLSALEEAVELLGSLRADLDYCFSRIRSVKAQLAQQRPDLFRQLQEAERE